MDEIEHSLPALVELTKQHVCKIGAPWVLCTRYPDGWSILYSKIPEKIPELGSALDSWVSTFDKIINPLKVSQIKLTLLNTANTQSSASAAIVGAAWAEFSKKMLRSS